MNGYAITALLDTGANVSLIDRAWKDKYLPEQDICPLSQLMEESLNVTAVTGDEVPYDGYVEVVVNLQGNDDPDLSIRVPFLVCRYTLERPLVGFNVIQELIKSNESRPKLMSILVSLLSGALSIDSAKAEAIVSFIQAEQQPKVQNATVRVGMKEITVYPGQVAYITCKVPVDMSESNSLVLFEPKLGATPLTPLSIGAGLMEFQQTNRPYVKVPVSNHSKNTVTLPCSTVLGTIEAIDRVVETNNGNHKAQVNTASSSPSQNTNSALWHPPVDVSHLSEEQQKEVKQMLYEESGAFARDEGDIGCIPSLKLEINLKDNIPVQHAYASVPKPLYKEVKDYIQDLLAKGWIIKSKSPYAAPVVCVRKKDGSLRLCIDYRLLNQKTVPDRLTPSHPRTHRHSWRSQLVHHLRPG